MFLSLGKKSVGVVEQDNLLRRFIERVIAKGPLVVSGFGVAHHRDHAQDSAPVRHDDGPRGLDHDLETSSLGGTTENLNHATASSCLTTRTHPFNEDGDAVECAGGKRGVLARMVTLGDGKISGLEVERFPEVGVWRTVAPRPENLDHADPEVLRLEHLLLDPRARQRVGGIEKDDHVSVGHLVPERSLNIDTTRHPMCVEEHTEATVIELMVELNRHRSRLRAPVADEREAPGA